MARRRKGPTLQDRIKDAKEGLTLSTLNSGTVLLLETLYSFYRIEIVDGKKCKVQGGMTKTGEDRIPSPTRGIIIGSTWGGSAIKTDWIGKEMHLELAYGEDLENKLITSRIKNVTIEAPDGSWSYSMDWNKSD